MRLAALLYPLKVVIMIAPMTRLDLIDATAKHLYCFIG